MSVQDAVTALERLGLSNYEARVFVALQQLGTGSAETISDISEVPRSQVYGAADDLANRGLVEVIESTPKQYRPVSLAAARKQLTARLEHEQERAFENLDALRETEPDSTGEQEVSTLRGRQPIDDRIVELIGRARERVAFVAPAGDSLAREIASALREQGQAGVHVTVLTAQSKVAERFDGHPVRVIVMDEDNPADFAGRALMADGSTILLAVATDEDEAVDEEAMWTADTSIGRILSQFMQSGMESGRERRDPPVDGSQGRGPDDSSRGRDPVDDSRSRDPVDGSQGRDSDDGSQGRDSDDGSQGRDSDDGSRGRSPDDSSRDGPASGGDSPENGN
jgi:sugar-specific transcriptional regulator TrmB